MPEPSKPGAPEPAKSFLDLVKEARALERKAVPIRPEEIEAEGELHFIDPSPPDIQGMSYWDILNELVKIKKAHAFRLSQAVYSAGRPKPELAGMRLGAKGFEALQKTLKGQEGGKGEGGASNAKK